MSHVTCIIDANSIIDGISFLPEDIAQSKNGYCMCNKIIISLVLKLAMKKSKQKKDII